MKWNGRAGFRWLLLCPCFWCSGGVECFCLWVTVLSILFNCVWLLLLYFCGRWRLLIFYSSWLALWPAPFSKVIISGVRAATILIAMRFIRELCWSWCLWVYFLVAEDVPSVVGGVWWSPSFLALWCSCFWSVDILCALWPVSLLISWSLACVDLLCNLDIMKWAIPVICACPRCISDIMV